QHTRFSRDWSTDVCSSDLLSLQNLCTRVICLEHGRVIADGQTDSIIHYYLNKQQGKSGTLFVNEKNHKEVYIKSFKITSQIKTRSEERRVGKEKKHHQNMK